jgi:hypothetical protein
MDPYFVIFLEKVETMRELQNRYKRTRMPMELEAARKAVQEVDEYIRMIRGQYFPHAGPNRPKTVSDFSVKDLLNHKS